MLPLAHRDASAIRRHEERLQPQAEPGATATLGEEWRASSLNRNRKRDQHALTPAAQNRDSKRNQQGRPFLPGSAYGHDVRSAIAMAHDDGANNAANARLNRVSEPTIARYVSRHANGTPLSLVAQSRTASGITRRKMDWTTLLCVTAVALCCGGYFFCLIFPFTSQTSVHPRPSLPPCVSRGARGRVVCCVWRSCAPEHAEPLVATHALEQEEVQFSNGEVTLGSEEGGAAQGEEETKGVQRGYSDDVCTEASVVDNVWCIAAVATVKLVLRRSLTHLPVSSVL